MGELDDAGFVGFVAFGEEEVDEQGGLLGDVAGDGGAHADAVGDEVGGGEFGVGECVVETVGIGADFERGALGEPVDEAFGETGLRREVGGEDFAEDRCGFEAAFAELPFVDRENVEGLVHEEYEVDVEDFGQREQAAWSLGGFERDGEAVGEP